MLTSLTMTIVATPTTDQLNVARSMHITCSVYEMLCYMKLLLNGLCAKYCVFISVHVCVVCVCVCVPQFAQV